MSTWRIRVLIVIGIVMAAAACGGGTSGDATPDDTTSSTPTTADTGDTAATPTTSPSDTSAPETGTDGGGESVGRVTVDGATYEFGMVGPAATCDPDFFGGFFAVLYTDDLSGTLSVELWNPDSGEGRTSVASMNITADDGTEYDYEANPEKSWPTIEAGTSRVESFTYEGNRASGTAYFIDSEVAFGNDGPYDPVVADFEVVCADE